MTKRRDPAQPASDGPSPDRGASQGTAPAKTFPIYEHIGRQLRDMFEDVAAEPVPDKLRKLLDELDRKRSGE